MKSYFTVLLFFLSVTTYALKTSKNQDHFKLITFSTEDDGTIEASLFEGKKDLVIIFAHGAVFSKESWYFLAEKLQSKGIASLSIDFRGYGNSKTGTSNNLALDILGAIDYLKDQGYKSISLVGGSMGGAAILKALELKTDDTLNKVVLLSPASNKGIASTTLKKLIVVSKDEGLFNRVKTSFETSSEPKEFKIYEGSFHAQHMFKSDYAEELTQLIIDFITN
jgi:alpha-beta hydrolase superfamily lysophospholipase